MEKMNELFYRDPYKRSFRAEVVECIQGKDAWMTVLSDTAFYPEGGGQEADHGTINGIEVFDVHRKDGKIVHYMKGPVEAGMDVECRIDWDRRFDHMQNHTGEHIVSGLIHREFGYDNVGFHMGKEIIQIDFNGPLTWEDLMGIEQKANQIVMNDVPLHIWCPEKEELDRTDFRSKKELNGTVRLVEVAEADLCACCGTHVASTGEIGLIKILSVAKYKNGVRVEMVSGNRAVNLMREVYNNNRSISACLSAEMCATSQAVEKLKAELQKKDMLIGSLQSQLLEYRLASFETDQDFLMDVEENMDRVMMIHMADRMMEEKSAKTAAVLSKQADGYAYFICSKTVNLAVVSKQLNAQLNGRGGGRQDNIQGFFQSDIETIREVFVKTFTKS